MPSNAGQSRLVWRGTLLAVMIGSGWGCAQLVGADFNDNGSTSGAGGSDTTASGSGGAGGMTSTNGSGGGSATTTSSSTPTTTGSSTSTTSTSTTSTSTTTTSGASSSSGGSCLPQGSPDSLCGPDGKDDNCNGVVGDCDDIQTVYVGMKVADADDCTSKATDFRISTSMGDLPSDFPVVAQFKTFTQKPSGTHVIELSTCVGGGGKHIISFGLANCTPSSSEYKSLGYVSTTPGNGYEQLLGANIMGTTTVFPASANAAGNKACCHTSCSAVSEYVLQ